MTGIPKKASCCINETTADKLQRIAASGLYECMICLDMVRHPVKCSNCNKVLCQDHIRKIQNRCPNCRTTPFRFYEDATFTKIVEGYELNQRSLERPYRQFECLAVGCKFTGNYTSMLKHRRKAHPEISIEDLLYNEKAKLEKEKRKALLEVLKNMAKHQQMQIAFFCVQNPKQPPPGELKKHPDFEQARRMVCHVTECVHNRGPCSKLWNTNWGTYIGRKRAEGQDELDFYFTECPEGRQLNEQLGWNYLDPRH